MTNEMVDGRLATRCRQGGVGGLGSGVMSDLISGIDHCSYRVKRLTARLWVSRLVVASLCRCNKNRVSAFPGRSLWSCSALNECRLLVENQMAKL